MYASPFYHTINTTTRITATSKTLIDNIFYNDSSKKIGAANITTFIFDHLTQCLIISMVADSHQREKTFKIGEKISKSRKMFQNREILCYKSREKILNSMTSNSINLYTRKRGNKRNPLYCVNSTFKYVTCNGIKHQA